MTDLILRDAAILITVKAARANWITPDTYLARYFPSAHERESALDFMYLMEMVYEGYEEIGIWDPEYALNKTHRRVLMWKDDE